jgi:hypothetical protein
MREESDICAKFGAKIEGIVDFGNFKTQMFALKTVSISFIHGYTT